MIGLSQAAAAAAIHRTAPAPRAGDIEAIQYLRAIAALMVVWHHAAGQVPGVSSLVPWVFGTSGVDIFFVISGFIMVVTTTGTDTRPAEFWRRRVVRVVPLYWLLTLLMVAMALAAPGLFKTLKVAPVTLLQSLFFIPHFSQSFPNQVYPLLVPGWTLNFEMFFYAVFGAFLVLPRHRRLMALTTAFFILVGAGLAMGPFESAAARTYTHPMLLEFLAGACVGAMWSRGQLHLPLAASLLMVACGVVMLVLRDSPPFGVFTQIIGAALIVPGALHPRFSSWRSRVFRAIGDSSYSLYLTHLFTLGVMRMIWTRLVHSSPDALTANTFMVLSLVACSLTAWYAYRWVEMPLLRSLNRAPKAPTGLSPR